MSELEKRLEAEEALKAMRTGDYDIQGELSIDECYLRLSDYIRSLEAQLAERGKKLAEGWAIVGPSKLPIDGAYGETEGSAWVCLHEKYTSDPDYDYWVRARKAEDYKAIPVTIYRAGKL